MKFEFIDAPRAEFEVAVRCRVREVSRSGYYAWRQRPISQREACPELVEGMANQQLLEQIKEIYQQSRQTYGWPRIHAELVKKGVKCSLNRVARLRRVHGISAQQKRKFKHPPDSRHRHPVTPNLLTQDFSAQVPDQTWLADMTYVPTDEGGLYLAAIRDLDTRRMVGWAMDHTLNRSLVLTALHLALSTRQPAPGLIHHSDRGSQYASADYQARLTKNQIQARMSGTGHCYDNAPMESFFATLKTALVHRQRFRTRDQARMALCEHIEVFYKRLRSHSALAYHSPVDYEQLALIP